MSLLDEIESYRPKRSNQVDRALETLTKKERQEFLDVMSLPPSEAPATAISRAFAKRGLKVTDKAIHTWRAQNS